MAHILSFLDGRHAVEDFFLKNSIARIGINSEITYSERGEVLEEVGALRRIYMIVLQTCLNDNSGSRDMGPLDWNAQPIVARAPAARTYQDIVFILCQETTVNLLYLVGNDEVVSCSEVIVSLNVDHIDHILRDAMSQRVVRAKQTLRVGNSSQVFIKDLFGVDNRTYLKQIEVASRIIA